MTPSLRRRLTVSVVVVLAGVFLCFAVLLDRELRRASWGRFDRDLEIEAQDLADRAEDHGGGTLEFEYGGIPEYERADRPSYFEVRSERGLRLGRSGSLRGGELPPLGPPGEGVRLGDVRLPDGRPGREAEVTVEARWDAPGVPPRDRPRVTVRVARSTVLVTGTIRHLRRRLAEAGLLVLLGGVVAALATVSIGLRPARVLAEDIARIDSSTLGRPLEVKGLPSELEPPVSKLNELLGRLSESFLRERRFVADVSHELRTPLSALCTTLEWASAKKRSPSERRAAVVEALEVVRRLADLAGDLLLLARADARSLPVRDERVALRPLVEACWRPLAPSARSRRLVFRNEVPHGRTLRTDRALMEIVLKNLIENAVLYSERGGSIEVRGTGNGGIEVWDSGPPLADEVLPRVFERFYRGDPSRTGGGHAGIGLSIAESLSKCIRWDLTAANPPGGGVSFLLVPRGDD